jgi:hypothetical protein
MMTKVQKIDAAPSLEERAVGALTDDTVSSAALAALLGETTSAIAAAEATAASCKERAFDLALGHAEAKEAHGLMVDASFRADRLRTLGPRLQARWLDALQREAADAWRRERDAFEASIPNIEAVRANYEAALQQMLKFFTEVTAFNSARSRLLSRRPEHCGLESATELPITALNKLLGETRLFDLKTGEQVWPDPQQANKFAVEMSHSVSAMMKTDPDDYTPNWWRAAARRQAASRVAAEHHAAQLRQLERDQTGRVNREEQEAFNARHGVGK